MDNALARGHAVSEQIQHDRSVTVLIPQPSAQEVISPADIVTIRTAPVITLPTPPIIIIISSNSDSIGIIYFTIHSTSSISSSIIIIIIISVSNKNKTREDRRRGASHDRRRLGGAPTQEDGRRAGIRARDQGEGVETPPTRTRRRRGGQTRGREGEGGCLGGLGGLGG